MRKQQAAEHKKNNREDLTNELFDKQANSDKQAKGETDRQKDRTIGHFVTG